MPKSSYIISFADSESNNPYKQWWNLTEYIYSGTVLKYKFEVLVLPFYATLYFYWFSWDSDATNI